MGNILEKEKILGTNIYKLRIIVEYKRKSGYNIYNTL